MTRHRARLQYHKRLALVSLAWRGGVQTQKKRTRSLDLARSRSSSIPVDLSHSEFTLLHWTVATGFSQELREIEKKLDGSHSIVRDVAHQQKNLLILGIELALLN